jgi:hypothetical protein
MAKKKPGSTIPPEKLAGYKKLVTSIPGLELKGAAMPYTSVNGNMSSFLDKDGNLALRLSAEKRDEFIDVFETQLAEQHGVTLKEYVWVPNAAFSKTLLLKKYFQQSHEYVKGLKPKPARR